MTWKASVKLDDDDEGETPYALSIVEVGSARQYDYLRQQTYAGANAFVLCFDVGDYRDETMKDVRERWAAECRSQGAHIPIILVGTKIDQRQGTLRAFTPEQVSQTLPQRCLFSQMETGTCPRHLHSCGGVSRMLSSEWRRSRTCLPDHCTCCLGPYGMMFLCSCYDLGLVSTSLFFLL